MTKAHLNLTAEAWKNLRRIWRPPLTAGLLWQSAVVGPVLSRANAMQMRVTASACAQADLCGAVVILGYWRSGTTLLHEVLSASGRWNFPTTHACMNPQTFAIGSAAGKSGRAVRRQMDDMTVTDASPQEDEFALLGLGARSPYEALLFPDRLHEALRLADVDSLTPDEQAHWRKAFDTFIRQVAVLGTGKPMLLKSPPHASRIRILRETLPRCKFIVLVRNPYEVFESVAKLWRRLFESYALSAIPDDDEIRREILLDRPAYEEKLQAGLKSLSSDEYAVVRFEELVTTPAAVVEDIYCRLGLPDASAAAAAAQNEMRRRAGYRPAKTQPSGPWKRRLNETWSPLFARYGYETGE